MRDNTAFFDSAFAASNTFQNAETSVKSVEGLNGHKICSGFTVLSDEHWSLVGLKISDDFGGLPFERGDEFSSHEMLL